MSNKTNNRIHKLPSGAKLEIQVAPFADSRALYQAVLEEVRLMKLDPNAEMDVNFLKDMFCAGLSSKKIEAALDQCFKRCTYDDQRITDATWEPLIARGDYLDACFEVAQDNIEPFMKNLYAKFSQVQAMMPKSPT